MIDSRKCPALSGRADPVELWPERTRGRELASFAKGRTTWRLTWCWWCPRPAWTGSSGRSSWSAMPCARRTPAQAYLYALEQFFQWAAGRAISRESVQGYVTWLGEMKFSPSTINQRLAAIRKLATEAQRCGYVDSETAQAIVTVAGVSQKGRRLGRWLAWEEARTLLQAPNPHSIRGMRDRALLGVLVTCALRRGELSRMNCEHLAMRDGRWVFLDFLGKGNKIRSVAVPLWVKQAIDGWLETAGIEKGPIFRRVSANGRVGEDALTERAVWQLVREYAQQIGIGELAPHDLRRTAAKLCRSKGGELEQIQFLLGHESILTTERYLGSEQDLKNAVNDALVFE